MSTAAWTWMIYLATHGKPGDSALAFGNYSIERMRRASLSEQVRVLLQQDTADAGGVRRIIGATPEIVANLGEIDSGDPNTLIEFIRWAKATAPAERYALVLWSHGSGWEPDEMARLPKDSQSSSQSPLVSSSSAAPRTRGVRSSSQPRFGSC